MSTTDLEQSDPGGPGQSIRVELPRVLPVATLLAVSTVVVQWASQNAYLTLAFVCFSLSSVTAWVAIDRRTRRRSRIRRTVTCVAWGCTDIVECITLDLSPRGFFIQTAAPYALLTRFRFELQLFPDEPPVVGYGVVRWINRHPPCGMGVEIVRLDDPERFHQLVERAAQCSTWERVSRFFASFSY